jgi:polar amino acid transport system substrate-binding protein
VKLRMACIEEAPFCWTAEVGSVTGTDISLADAVLPAIGVTAIEHLPASVDEYLPGVQQSRRDRSVPIFVTAERAQHVAFRSPVRALGDGFLVRRGNPRVLTGCDALAAQRDARLGVIAGQVQIASSTAAGGPDGPFVMFRSQPEAIAALVLGQIDLFAATAEGDPSVEAVAHEVGQSGKVPVGASSFTKCNHSPLQAVTKQLHRHFGSADHRGRMPNYGITRTEIDAVPPRS